MSYIFRTNTYFVYFEIYQNGTEVIFKRQLPVTGRYSRDLTVFKDVCLVPRHCSHLSSQKLAIIRKSASQIERIRRVLDNCRLQHNSEFKCPWVLEGQISKLVWRNNAYTQQISWPLSTVFSYLR
jgi:hypothetical protein